MKYIIDIPDDSINKYVSLRDRESFVVPITVGLDSSLCFNTGLKLKPYTEPDRKAIEDAQEEVWNFARKIILSVSLGGLTTDEIRDCFGNDNVFFDVLRDFSYQEAKAKYDAWKEKKNKIHVGDEVKHKQCEWEAFVTNISESGYLTLMWDLGEASSGFDPENFEKTGKHCAEIEELVKKIKENS